MSIDHDGEAASIVAAHAGRTTLNPISDHSPLTLDDAYVIQRLVTRARLDRGQRRVGWKLGYTSAVMREQMGVDTPNFGPLTDAMAIDDGGILPATMTQPRVEPEIALRFGVDVEAGADRATVLGSIDAAFACLEVVDSVWTDYRFRIEDNTADGSSAAGFVLGDQIPIGAIATSEIDIEVRLYADGVEVGAGNGRDASGHPADGVVWLVEQLSAVGERLTAGDVVLTGGLTRAVPIRAGDTVSAVFAQRHRVAVRG